MGRTVGLIAIALVGSLSLFPLRSAAHETVQEGELAPGSENRQQGMRGEEQKSPQQLSAADDLQGMKVQNPQGNEIGSVDKLIVDTGAGKLAYVVISPGNAEIGGEQLIVPWNALRAVQPAGAQGQEKPSAEQSLVLDISQDQLKDAPKGDIRDVLDREKGRQVHQFYGISPYWQEEQQLPQQQMIEPAPPLPPGHPPVLPPGHPPVAPPGEEPQAPQGEAL